MKLPDIGVNDLFDKNSYSLNKMKGSAKEGLSGMIVDLLGIGPKDVKVGSSDTKKFQKTLNDLLQVSKKTEQHLNRISNLLEKGALLPGGGSARVNVSGVPGYSDISRGAKRGASDIFRATATRQVIDRLRIPRDVKGASPSNWEVLDKEGNVISKPTVSKIPALPAPPLTPPPPTITLPNPEEGPGGMPIPPVGGRLGTAILRRAPILMGAAAADTALGMMGVGGKQINDEQDEENWNRMSTFQKAQSGFARGIEKVGTVFGMGNVANEARYNRVMNETNYFRNIDDAKGGPQSSTFVPKTEGEAALRGGGLSEESQIFKPEAKGLSQVLDEQNNPTLFSRIGSKIANVKNEISFAYNRGVGGGETPGEQELDAKMEDIIAAREKEGNPLERFSQEYNDIRNKLRKEIEAKNPQAFVQAEQKIGSELQLRKASSASSEGVTNETELNKAITSSKSLFGSEFLGGLATKKGLTKEFSTGDTSISTEKDGQYTNERSDVTARRISGGFFGRDKYKVTLDGEDVDVDKQYYSQIKGLLDAGKPKEAAALARHIRDQSQDLVLRSPEETVTPMSPGASSLPVALNQLSAENRDLGREETSAPVQPVIIQSNNNMASQNFVPTPAQPRSQSSFARIQERNAAYG